VVIWALRFLAVVYKGAGEPQPYQKRQVQVAPQLGEFHDVILELLREDEQAPPTRMVASSRSRIHSSARSSRTL